MGNGYIANIMAIYCAIHGNMITAYYTVHGRKSLILNRGIKSWRYNHG
jgi:hypothetical protein